MMMMTPALLKAYLFLPVSPSCLHSQSYSLNSLFAGSNANKEKRIGVPFAPFQAPLPSASKSAIHASATAAAETLPIDGTNNVTER